MSRAKKRCVNNSLNRLNPWWRLWFNHVSVTPWIQGHRVEKDFLTVADCLKLPSDIPALCFEKSDTIVPESIRDLHDFAIIHPGSRWISKRWPNEHWIRLGQSLLKQTMCIVVSCGPAPDERKQAAELVAKLGSQHAISSDGQWTWAELAACLHRTRVLVGVDTAAIHLAAACQCPIVGIYSHILMHHWKPWRAQGQLLHPGQWLNSREEILLIRASEIMRAHQPGKVFAAAREIMRAPVPDQAG